MEKKTIIYIYHQTCTHIFPVFSAPIDSTSTPEKYPRVEYIYENMFKERKSGAGCNCVCVCVFFPQIRWYDSNFFFIYCSLLPLNPFILLKFGYARCDDWDASNVNLFWKSANTSSIEEKLKSQWKLWTREREKERKTERKEQKSHLRRHVSVYTCITWT